jgi:5-methylcytosine-specific restriction endonuclease McrA
MYAWQDIPWHKVERAVFKLQQRIYRASRHGDVFKHGEDMVERDHIIPTSRGGDGKTTNLQLLHGHCHDVKTAKDKAVAGILDKNHTTEEPCERKRTRTVLKPRQRGRPRCPR